MIFLSHNSNDKPIVRQIAETLVNVYGREQVFYDEWSIQPGDSIIDKMNNGISECQYFFFFISENSLNSKMVELEWQSALMKYCKQGIKFIPVRIDKSILPAIISQHLYIDLYTNGLNVACRQIIDVINGNNTYRSTQKFSNLIAKASHTTYGISIVISAEYYMEPHSRYLLLVDNNEEDLIWYLPDFTETVTGFNKDISFSNGKKHNCILIEVASATSPDFPIRIELKSKNNTTINLLFVMHATSRKDFSSIPLIWQETENDA